MCVNGTFWICLYNIQTTQKHLKSNHQHSISILSLCIYKPINSITNELPVKYLKNINPQYLYQAMWQFLKYRSVYKKKLRLPLFLNLFDCIKFILIFLDNKLITYYLFYIYLYLFISICNLHDVYQINLFLYIYSLLKIVWNVLKH